MVRGRDIPINRHKLPITTFESVATGVAMGKNGQVKAIIKILLNPKEIN